MFSRNRHHIVYGGPGTGKSFLLRALKNGCESIGKACVKTAGTGVASLLVGGITIHSKLQLQFDETRQNWRTLLLDSLKCKELEKVDTLIVDEFSMLGCMLFETICQIMNDDSLEQIKIVTIGDPYQLPSVEDVPFYFSNWFNRFELHKLLKNERQKNNVLSSVVSNFYNFDILLNKRITGGFSSEELNKLFVLEIVSMTTTNTVATKRERGPNKDQAFWVLVAVEAGYDNGPSCQTAVIKWVETYVLKTGPANTGAEKLNFHEITKQTKMSQEEIMHLIQSYVPFLGNVKDSNRMKNRKKLKRHP